MSKKKGDRRENDAAGFYSNAGYAVEKSHGQRWGRTDWFGHFDLMAMRSDAIRFVQVKSNGADGIAAINRWARRHAPAGVLFDMPVAYDRDGWRLVRLWPEGDTYTTAVDEREMDCKMGEGVTDYLRGDD